MQNCFSKILVLAALLSITSSTIAQTEYLVVVNPSNAALTKVDSIPGVTWIRLYYTSAYCETRHRYTLVAGEVPTGNPFYLFTLDAVSGDILSNTLFADHVNFVGLDYTRSGDTLYGVTFNAGLVSVASVNITTGAYSIIRTVPGLVSVVKFLVDDLHNRFIIAGPDGVGNLTLVTMDISSGNIISRVITPRINNLLYNKSTNKFYAISNRNGAPPNNSYIFSLSTVDPATGVITNLADIPNLLGLTPGSETLDENNNLYFFAGFERNDTTTRLYVVSTSTGNVVHKPSIPINNNVMEKDNLIQFRYDNISKKLYALLWEGKTIVQPPVSIDSTCKLDIKTKIYPNPVANILTIDKDPTTCKVKMNLYNMLGQLILKDRIINDGHNEVRLSYLSSGIYYYKFTSGEKMLLTGNIYKY